MHIYNEHCGGEGISMQYSFFLQLHFVPGLKDIRSAHQCFNSRVSTDFFFTNSPPPSITLKSFRSSIKQKFYHNFEFRKFFVIPLQPNLCEIKDYTFNGHIHEKLLKSSTKDNLKFRLIDQVQDPIYLNILFKQWSTRQLSAINIKRPTLADRS